MRTRHYGIVGMLLLYCMGCDRGSLADGLPARLDCSGCHGGSDNAAPPRAVNGETGTWVLAVGAHQAHMRAGKVGKNVACEACHIVPTSMDGNAHPDPDGRPASMNFGDIAVAGGASPTWRWENATCAGTYCHGATLRGASSRSLPVWTTVDGSQLRCTACHGNPPGEGHPESDRCELCHGDVVAEDGSIKNTSLHVDGVIQLPAEMRYSGGFATSPANARVTW